MPQVIANGRGQFVTRPARTCTDGIPLPFANSPPVIDSNRLLTCHHYCVFWQLVQLSIVGLRQGSPQNKLTTNRTHIQPKQNGKQDNCGRAVSHHFSSTPQSGCQPPHEIIPGQRRDCRQRSQWVSPHNGGAVIQQEQQISYHSNGSQ